MALWLAVSFQAWTPNFFNNLPFPNRVLPILGTNLVWNCMNISRKLLTQPVCPDSVSSCRSLRSGACRPASRRDVPASSGNRLGPRGASVRAASRAPSPAGSPDRCRTGHRRFGLVTSNLGLISFWNKDKFDFKITQNSIRVSFENGQFGEKAVLELLAWGRPVLKESEKERSVL